MKLKVNLDGVNPKYYDEFMFIRMNYKKTISSNPRQVVGSYIKSTIESMGLSLTVILVALITIIFSLDSIVNLVINVGLLVLSGVIFAANLIKYIAIRKFLKTAPNVGRTKTFELGNDEIKYEEENMGTVTVKWNCIDMILINKYTVVFITKHEKKDWLLAIPIDFKSEIIKAVEGCGKKELIVDNTALYEQHGNVDIGKRKKMCRSIFLNVVLLSLLVSAFFYVYNVPPDVVLKEELTVYRNDKVSNISFIEEVIDGEIVSKEKKIDTSELGKQKVVVEVENIFDKKFEYQFFVTVVENE